MGQGKLKAAQADFVENLVISRRLAESDPCPVGSDGGALSDGPYLRPRRLDKAHTAFAENLAISRRLAESTPATPAGSDSAGPSAR
jgi:hypothetical protein